MEAALYVTPPIGSPQEPMPQAVMAESKLTASPINRTSAAIVGTGAMVGIDPVVKAIDAARGVADSAGSLREPLATIKTIMVDTLGIQPDWVLPIVLIAGGIDIMYWRKRQRDEGRA